LIALFSTNHFIASLHAVHFNLAHHIFSSHLSMQVRHHLFADKAT